MFRRRAPFAPSRRVLTPGARRRRRFRPSWSPELEDRILLAVTQVDFNGLRFVDAAGFTRSASPNEWTADAGAVAVGFIPGGTDAFTPLIRMDLDVAGGAFTIDLNNFQFKVENAVIDVVAAGGSVGVVAAKGGNGITLPIGQLTGLGVPFQDADASPITVTGVTFTTNKMILAKPVVSGKVDPQVKLQGTASFAGVPLVKDLGIKAAVNGPNFVVFDASGADLTGLSVTVPIPDKASVDGLDVKGQVTIGYTHGTNTYTFSGGVTVASTDQSNGALKDLGASLNVVVANGSLQKFGFSVSTNFTVRGLTVATLPGKPVALEYQTTNQDFELSGAVLLKFNANTIQVDMGTISVPGLVVEHGALKTFDAKISGGFTVFGASLTTAGTSPLDLNYSAATDDFSMTGGVTLTIPTGGTKQQITAQFVSPSGGPGLVIQGGALKTLDISLSGTFSLYDLKLSVQNAFVDWTPGTSNFLLGGTFTADFNAFQTELQLGSGTNPGIEIVNGAFKVDAVAFSLQNASIGPLTLQDLTVSYKVDGNSYDLAVSVTAYIGSTFHASGGFVLIKGRLDSISLSGTFAPGELEVGDTGLSVTNIAATVTNIEDPANIVVTGSVGMIWGEQFTLLGKTVNLFHVQGTITASANELIIDCQAQLGAYSSDNGATWQGVFGSGDAKLTLDWQTNYYALHIDVNGLLGVFDVEGDLVFQAGDQIALLATASVVVPSWVPFIGGDKLGGFGFFFQHVFAHDNTPTSTTFAAWINLDIIWMFTVGFEIVVDPSGEHFSLIGGGTVKQFQQDVLPPVQQTYTYNSRFVRGSRPGQLPAGATSLILSTDWSQSEPGVTLRGQPTFTILKNGQPIPRSQWAAEGISAITDARFSGPTKAAFQIVGSPTDPDAPLAADYTLQESFTTQGGNPFPDFPNPGAGDVLNVQALYVTPSPTFGPRNGAAPYTPPVPAAPDAAFPVTLAGTVDEADFTDPLHPPVVRLYRQLVSDPQHRSVLIGSSPLTRIDPPQNGVNWSATFNVPIAGLSPQPYVLYAVLFDGANAPLVSADSAPFTPTFAVQGLVQNQNQAPESGWTIFLDLNNDGKQDPNDPVATTSADGFYSFEKSVVPMNTSFRVHLIVQAPGNFDAVASPSITYNGATTQAVPFNLREHSAVQGTVFTDAAADGLNAPGAGVPGAMVYLDSNGNGRRDPGEPTTRSSPTGRYDFPNLAAGTYKLGVDVTSLGLATPTAAYAVPAGTIGQQTGTYTYGMTFTVDRPIQITSLGVFDSAGDGFHITMTASIYDAAKKILLTSLTFSPADPGVLVGGTRFKTLASPLTLMPGFQGMITAFGFNDLDRAGNANLAPTPAGAAWSVQSGVGRLGFGRSFFATAYNQFPTIPDSNPRPDVYAAGSFQFRDAAWLQTSPNPKTTTVTVGASGYDVRDGNDFGVLPPAFVAGNVSGHAAAGGSLVGSGQDLSGWAVLLKSDAPVARVDAGSPASGSGGYSADSYNAATGGDSQASIVAGGVNDPAPQGVYQSFRTSNGAFAYVFSGLSPSSPYVVRLHFAELVFDAPGKRQFNVAINGRRTLSNFDVFAAAQGRDRAVVKEFTATSDANGVILVDFTPGAADLPMVSGLQVMSATPLVALNVGSPIAYVGYNPDAYFSGGSTGVQNDGIFSNIADPAPGQVMNSYRAGSSFQYAIPDLVPGATYSVRLHFAELAAFGVTRPGQRLFSITANGQTIQRNFDIVAQAGAIDVETTLSFNVAADASGVATIAFASTSARPALLNALELFQGGVVSVDAGSSAAVGMYSADTFGSQAVAPSPAPPVVRGQVFDAAPVAVYQTYREGDAFAYTVNGLTAGAAYDVRLHFAELAYNQPFRRQFNVFVNDAQVLSNFDVYVAAGGASNTAVVKTFHAFADAQGNIHVAFGKGAVGRPEVNGIEVVAPGAVIASATTLANGDYAIVAPTVGNVTVVETLQSGWRQVSPFHSNLAFAPTTLPAGSWGSARPVAADFNGDGFLDLAFVNNNGVALPSTISVFYNGGDGRFILGVTLQNPIAGAGDVVAADVNGDHRPDLVVLNQPQGSLLSVYLNTGSGVPVTQFQYTPSFWPASTPPGTYPLDLAAGDLNGDGLDDLLVSYNGNANASGGVEILLNSASPGGRSTTAYPITTNATLGNVVVGDLNGDDKLDVLTPIGVQDPAYSQFNTALGDGNGGLLPWVSVYTGPYAQAIAALGEVQSSGSRDVALLELPGVAQVALNQAGSFNVLRPVLPYVPNPFATNMRGIALADVNGDGRADLIVDASATGPSGANAVAVYSNTGAAPYFLGISPFVASLPEFANGFVAGQILAADFNNDGFNDILVANGSPGASQLLMNQSGQVQPGAALFLQPGAVALGNDFVNAQNPAGSSVYGVVYDDVGRNARRDPGDPGRPGVRVFADLNGDGRYTPNEPSTFTVGGGAYNLTGLPAGTYPIRAVLPDAARIGPSAGQAGAVTLDGRTALPLDLGVVSTLLRTPPVRPVLPGQTISLTVPSTPAAAGRKLLYSLLPGAPAGATVDPATGLVTWTPKPADATRDVIFQVRGYDPYQPLFTDVAAVRIHVAGALAATIDGPRSGSVYDALRYTLRVQSPATGPFTYWINWGDGSSQFAVGGATLSLTHLYRRAGAYAIVMRANDPAGDVGVTGSSVVIASAAPSGRGAGRDAFVTVLYRQQLGRDPGAADLAFWSGRLAAGVDPWRVAVAISGSPERRALLAAHLIPRIPLVRTYAAALAAGRTRRFL